MDESGPREKLTWKCANCGHTVSRDAPPEKCPSCGEECEFLNASCYIPDCGGDQAGTMDPGIRGKGMK